MFKSADPEQPIGGGNHPGSKPVITIPRQWKDGGADFTPPLDL